jgi:MarR family transcriptional regulator, 2-MHQ and catechol-resistance regulon repressor
MTNYYNDERVLSYGRFIAAYSRIYRKIGQTLQDEAGLPCPWFEILLLIAQSEEGHPKMSELAKHVLLTTGGITRLIDRMEDAKLVLRMPCPTDRRIQWVVLTDYGRDQLDHAIALHVADLDKYFLEPFTAAEFNQFNDLIDKLRTSNQGED